MSNDIENIQDIQQFVNAFYTKVQKDNLLAPIFEFRVQGNWDKHLQTMYRFWDSVLFGKGSYKGSPFMKHADLPIYTIHFERWVRLFHETIDTYFEGNKAEETKKRASRMATMFASKRQYLRDNPQIKPLF